jgi:hypothetical protein
MTLPPSEIVVQALREVVGPPFVITVVLVALARLLGRRAVLWVAPLALLGSLAYGTWATEINPDWWPTTKRITWLPWLALGGCLAGVLIRGLKQHTLGYTAWAIALAFLLTRVLHADYYTKPLWFLPTFVAVLGINSFAPMHLYGRFPGFVTPLIMALCLGTTGTVLIHAHSKSLMDMAMFVSMALTGLACVVAITKGDASSVYPGVGLLHLGLLFAGYHETYSELPMAVFIIPAGAPLLALVGLLPRFDRLRPWLRVLIILLPVLIALGVTLGITMSYEELSFGTEEEQW